MKNRIIIVLTVMIGMTYSTYGQSLVGLWGFTKVSVGDKIMTPVSKWVQFDKDGTSVGGNGWTQNLVGTWVFDKQTHEFVPTNNLGIKDDFGPFIVSFSEDTMKWTRQEEGETVIVSLVRVEEMPPGPGDLVKGLWDLSRAENVQGNILENYDKEDKQFIFVRPDMRFKLRNPDSSVTKGFWHMDGHKPILTLINYDRTLKNEVYFISFKQGMLVMKPQSENVYYYYSRIHEFPE